MTRPLGVLLDENVSARLRSSFGVPVMHVTDWGDGLKDWALWERATGDSLVIVTQDADFTERMLTQEPPPWVVHVRTGNMRVQEFRILLDEVWPRIWSLLDTHKLVVLYRDRLEAVRSQGDDERAEEASTDPTGLHARFSPSPHGAPAHAYAAGAVLHCGHDPD